MSHIVSQLCCAVSDCGNYVASGSSGQQGSGSELTVRIMYQIRHIHNIHRHGVLVGMKGILGRIISL